MKTLDRYILRAFFVNYLIALSVMIGVYVVIDLFFNLDEFTKDSQQPVAVTVRNILDYYGHNMLMYFAQLAGVITVVAACCTLGRMHRANELTAVLASGTSLHRVALPVILAGLAMNLAWLVDQELLVPRVADKLARPHSDIQGATVYPVWFLADRDNTLVSAREFHPGSGAIRGFIAMHRDARGRMTRIVRADAAHWDPERRVWSLTVGIEERLAGDEVDAGGGPGRRSVNTYAGDITPEDVVIQQASAWTAFLSLADLSAIQRRFADDIGFTKVKHTRITTPFVNMILLLLAIPFFLTRERVSLIVAGGRGLLVCGLCFVLAFMGQNADFGQIISNPALPVWLPVLLFGPLAVLLLDGIRT